MCSPFRPSVAFFSPPKNTVVQNVSALSLSLKLVESTAIDSDDGDDGDDSDEDDEDDDDDDEDNDEDDDEDDDDNDDDDDDEGTGLGSGALG